MGLYEAMQCWQSACPLKKMSYPLLIWIQSHAASSLILQADVLTQVNYQAGYIEDIYTAGCIHTTYTC